MTAFMTRARAKSSSVRAVVKRADGRVENLGLVSYWHRNPMIRAAVNLWLMLKRK